MIPPVKSPDTIQHFDFVVPKDSSIHIGIHIYKNVSNGEIYGWMENVLIYVRYSRSVVLAKHFKYVYISDWRANSLIELLTNPANEVYTHESDGLIKSKMIAFEWFNSYLNWLTFDVKNTLKNRSSVELPQMSHL